MRRTKQPFYVGKTVIYDWLYSSYGQPYCQYLPSKHYRPKKQPVKRNERVVIPGRVPLTERPLGATNRTRYGHWEGDTMVSGKRTGGKAALAVCQERKTRLIAAQLIPDLRPVSFAAATTSLLLGKKALSLTLDNGIENKRHQDITAATGAQAFFCDPYSSWQKGQVEHANKLLRRYLPKGSDLGAFDQGFVDTVVDRLNKKPRKILGYKSALQCAVEKGII
jgi:IS30 family transposase